MLDDFELEVETIDLVGEEEPVWEVPARAVPAAPPTPEPPKTPSELERLTPELREVADEVLTSIKSMTPPEAIALVKRWVPLLGPDRFYSVFWAQAGMGTVAMARFAEAMAAAHAEGQKRRYADADVPRYVDKTSPERRLEVARTFAGICRQIYTVPGFDFRQAIDEACMSLGIKR